MGDVENELNGTSPNVPFAVTSCSWWHIKIEDIKKTIVASSHNIGDNDISDPDEITSFETSNVFNSNNITDPLEFEVTTNGAIRRIDVVSEGKVIEVFGGGQYVNTCHASFLDDFEGMAVYYGKIILPTMEKTITLRFTKARESSRVTIYGIRLELAPFLADISPVPVIRSLPLQLSELGKKLQELSIKNNRLFSSEVASIPPVSRSPVHGVAGSQECGACIQAVDDLTQKMTAELARVEENIMKEMQKSQGEILGALKALEEKMLETKKDSI